MWQFVADQIDQLDLALDQLAMRERNFDRFAMMLIDNVVELTLHQQARECSYENKSWGRDDDPKYDPNSVAQALGQAFDAKVRLARISAMLSDAVADSLLYLHGYRNAVYHQGVRHEGFLHGLAIFYFEIACGVLKAFNPMWWTSGNETLSHRAVKYLGRPGLADSRDAFPAACDRLLLVGRSLGDTLITDLDADMGETIERVDEQIKFLCEGSPHQITRQEAILSAQAWPLALTEKGKKWARENGYKATTVGGYVDWLSKNYPCLVRTDPIAGWRKRQESLRAEKDRYMGLKKYADFMLQTEQFRSDMDEAEASLSRHIDQQIDEARERRAMGEE
jgi:hypothetical protein